MSSDDPLISEMQDERKKWARSTIVYGTANVVLRLILIIISGIVAAGNNLSDSYAAFLVKWVSVFALAVTILTAIDSWLKPRDKWRGFMEDRDDLSNLLIRAQHIQSTGAASLDELREEFNQLRHRHRDKNVY